mgnify:CR=1 FL=1
MWNEIGWFLFSHFYSRKNSFCLLKKELKSSNIHQLSRRNSTDAASRHTYQWMRWSSTRMWNTFSSGGMAETLFGGQRLCISRYFIWFSPADQVFTRPVACRQSQILREVIDSMHSCTLSSWLNHWRNGNEYYYSMVNDTPGRVGPPFRHPLGTDCELFEKFLTQNHDGTCSSPAFWVKLLQFSFFLSINNCCW